MRIIKSTRCLLVSVATLLLSVMAGATQINSGGVNLEIPNPTGFTAITPQMSAIYDGQTKFWPDSAVHYLTFIGDNEIPIALKNEIPDMDRRLVVTTVKDVDGKNIRASDFSELKAFFKTQQEQLIKQVEKAMPEAMDKQKDRMFGKSGASIAVEVPQFKQFPAHSETARSFAFSTMNKYTLTGTDGKATPMEVSVTSTWIHVRGRALQLYAFGEKDGLDWTREASKQWSEAILAANPPDERSVALESGQKQDGGIDWMRSLVTGLIVAGVWGAFDFTRRKLAAPKSKDYC